MTTLTLLVLLAACNDSDDGFGGDGDRPVIPVDTGPFNTGDADTDADADTDSDADADTDTDTDTTDSGDSGDTGLGLEGSGYSKGDVAYNLKAPDQDDDDWALYAQYGSIVLLTFGDAADPQFQEIGSWTQALADKYGVTAASVLLTDATKTRADVDAAAAWADQYGLDTVLYRPLDGSVSTASWASAPPMIYVIGDDMVIYWTNRGNAEEGQVEDKIKDLALGN